MPIEVAGHKDPKTKGDRGLNSTESSFILVTLGELHSVGSCKSSKYNLNGKIATNSWQVSATIHRFLSTQPGFALLAALSQIGRLWK